MKIISFIILLLLTNVLLGNDNFKEGNDFYNNGKYFEAIKILNLDHEIIINVQGDMPTINPKTINMINDFMISNPNVSVSTVASKINEKEINDVNVVKVVTLDNLSKNKFLKSSDFVRSITKEKFFYHHIGLYAYKKNILSEFVKMNKTKNELNRSLEQMRFIDHNIDIFVGYTDDNPLSVDTKDDLKRIRKILRRIK